MKYLLIILTFAVGMLGMAAHAQTAGQSARGQIGGVATPDVVASVPAAATAPARSAEPGSMGIAIGAVIAVVAGVLTFVFVRGRRGQGSDSDGATSYESGYETIDPNVRPRREPSAKPTDDSMATRLRTDTIIAPWSVPADFDVPRFLRKAKAYFMRLQASWDKGDVRDIRQFTNRDIFGEFCMQLNARKELHNVTEVVTLGAELIGVETVDEAYVAVVKFTGMIKDAPDAQVAPFSEVWSMSKPTNGTRSWAITAIQQY